MRSLLLIFLLSGCAAEMKMAKEDPIMVTGAAAVFIGTIAGLAQ
jgi:hypothetical protein